MIEVLNRQRKLRLDCEHWEAFALKALGVLPTTADEATIVFVSDRRMRELNRVWRGKRGTTDVLSFSPGPDEFENPGGSNLGDVVISVEQAARQAKENNLSLDHEISQLILHGLIHLCGYDHSTDNGSMDRLEMRLRKKLGI
jgi:probable rRNA maturation factor